MEWSSYVAASVYCHPFGESESCIGLVRISAESEGCESTEGQEITVRVLGLTILSNTSRRLAMPSGIVTRGTLYHQAQASYTAFQVNCAVWNQITKLRPLALSCRVL